MNRGLAYIGEGIGFAGLCVAAAWLEINGKHSGGLWVVVVIWALCFGPGDKSDK